VPEGDTVWLAAKRMDDALGGRPLTRFDLRVPALATTDLTGRTVREVLARGKHMLTRFDGGITLHTHFRMDGSWRLGRPGERWRGGPAHQVRAILANTDREAVGYRLHDIKLVPTDQEDRLVGHLGPDVLGPDWDPEEAARRLVADPDRPVGEALLDQRVLAGVGNLYKAETLFLTGTHPWTPAGRTDAAKLVATAHRLMRANRDHPEQSTTGSMRRGESHWVFERPRRPCLRCGTPVEIAEQRPADHPEYGRLTYWCPRCQPRV
jgi:endonuclease VIII